ncbi:glutathione S-transferase [Alginatibacterium sediminis]|uniref:Glutathione S-transferase n=1 Tax=Alginatibacterium sediminis TaxID=2164068 RepID=A0A420E9S3_9ALTE|nr:glutathione S-transferase [Alginatibacterium sediminis]RKF17425.1 glutathione S-transferase [Alginatibacterium sediminis]
MELTNTITNTKPILYSLRNCPYAMRARIAVFKAKQSVVLRDVVLSDKPQAMLAASAKATVPILVLANGKVIDESLDVMLWALEQSDPSNLLQQDHPSRLAEMLDFIRVFDTEFKSVLDHYKCAKRYREPNVVECRSACEPYLQLIETRLNEHAYIVSDSESLVDIAVLPFIRQFARVERQWYLQSAYPKLRLWLSNYLQSPMFTKVMAKYPLWQEGQAELKFGA